MRAEPLATPETERCNDGCNDREAVLVAAVDRLTRAIASERTDDATIGELVAERRMMREELASLRETAAGVVRINTARRERR